MNIFILDYDLERNVQYYFDQHVVKMILEHVQILSAVNHKYGYPAVYKLTHQNHPCTKWAGETLDNWLYLSALTKYLHDEWRYRYKHPLSKVHKSFAALQQMPIPSDMPRLGDMTPFAQAMPVEYKCDDAVQAYRAYYMGAKRHLAKWKNRPVPEWWE